MEIKQLTGKFAVAKLPPKNKLPDWVDFSESFCSVTHTEDEISIVLPQAQVPGNLKCEKDMICFKIIGPLDFSLNGILAALISPLAKAKIPIFTIATYETDYILIHERYVDSARKVLMDERHVFVA